MLASSHYGERSARHWLDSARYADSNGYTIDGSRSIWKYRDWVIDALNRDLPLDQFAIEQLAGDLLPGTTLGQQIATGFHRNTLHNEGGTDAEQFRVEAVADRVETTAAVFLGLTIGCADVTTTSSIRFRSAVSSSLRSSTTATNRRSTCRPINRPRNCRRSLRSLPNRKAPGRQRGRHGRPPIGMGKKLRRQTRAVPTARRTASLLATPAEARSQEQLAAIKKAYRQIDKDLAPLFGQTRRVGRP